MYICTLVCMCKFGLSYVLESGLVTFNLTVFYCECIPFL